MGVDRHACEFEEVGAANTCVCRKQASTRCDNLHSCYAVNRQRKPPCISELSAEIQPAAKGENVPECRVPDLHLPRKLKGSFRMRKKLRATTVSTGG